MPNTSYPRIAETELRQLLTVMGAVVVEGPRGIGKTTLGSIVTHSQVRLDGEPGLLESARLDPSLLLPGPTPRLLDEWQLVPALWNVLRHAVDDRRQPGQFVLTGSAAPADDVTRHSGAGRIGRVRLRPLSSVEVGWSSGVVSLRALLDGNNPTPVLGSGRGYQDTLVHLCLGGWPAARITASEIDSRRYYRRYLGEIVRTDVPTVRGGSSATPQRLTRLVQALARHTATRVATTTLATDVGERGAAVARDTITADLSALARVFVTDDIPAWAPALTAQARLRGSSVRHFADPALAIAALGATPDSLLREPSLAGHLFESLVARDLRVYAQANEAAVYSYRDNADLEVDFVVEGPTGSWAAFEVKLARTDGDEASRTLRRLAAKVGPRNPPAALGIIHPGGGATTRRPDGVRVIPLDLLGP